MNTAYKKRGRKPGIKLVAENTVKFFHERLKSVQGLLIPIHCTRQLTPAEAAKKMRDILKNSPGKLLDSVFMSQVGVETTTKEFTLDELMNIDPDKVIKIETSVITAHFNKLRNQVCLTMFQ